jgi:hypothetical protein
VLKHQKVLPNIRDNEYNYVFLVKKDIILDSVTVQEKELSDVKWYTHNEINTLREGGQVVPHLKMYWDLILKSVNL